MHRRGGGKLHYNKNNIILIDKIKIRLLIIVIYRSSCTIRARAEADLCEIRTTYVYDWRAANSAHYLSSRFFLTVQDCAVLFLIGVSVRVSAQVSC